MISVSISSTLAETALQGARSMPGPAPTLPYYSPIKPKPRHQWCGVLLAKGLVLLVENGAPGKTRTSNPQIRSLVLYPIELRALRLIAGPSTVQRGRGTYTKPGTAASPKCDAWNLPKDMDSFVRDVPSIEMRTCGQVVNCVKSAPKFAGGQSCFIFEMIWHPAVFVGTGEPKDQLSQWP